MQLPIEIINKILIMRERHPIATLIINEKHRIQKEYENVVNLMIEFPYVFYFCPMRWNCRKVERFIKTYQWYDRDTFEKIKWVVQDAFDVLVCMKN